MHKTACEAAEVTNKLICKPNSIKQSSCNYSSSEEFTLERDQINAAYLAECTLIKQYYEQQTNKLHIESNI